MWLCEDTKVLQGSHNAFPSPIITVGLATFPARVGTQSETTDDVMQTAPVKLARTNPRAVSRSGGGEVTSYDFASRPKSHLRTPSFASEPQYTLQ